MIYLSTGLSIGMFLEAKMINLTILSVPKETVRRMLKANPCKTVIRNEILRWVLEDELEVELDPSRDAISLEVGDRLILAQYRGPRLRKYTNRLPMGATISWYLVSYRETRRGGKA